MGLMGCKNLIGIIGETNGGHRSEGITLLILSAQNHSDARQNTFHIGMGLRA